MGVEEVPDKLEFAETGVTEMEEDKRDDGKEEAEETDVDRKEVKVCKEVEAKTEAEESKNDNLEEEEESEVGKGNQEAVEEKFKGDDEGEVEEEGDVVKEDEEKLEEPKEEKGSKKRSRSKISAGKKGGNKKKKPEGEEQEQQTPSEKKIKEPKASVEEKRKEPKTPTPTVPTIERPVRKRKSVERLVATIERDYSNEFHVVKGRGTALKDIPNVAYKLSRKKTDDTFKMLHTILFGRRVKAAQVKSNISRFSGFHWKDDDEKQMIKLKEKLDKYVKEKLVEFCDVLDIPISKANSRKEDIIAALIEFLLEPHATTSELLADKDQGTKRKRVKSASGSSTQSKGSATGRKKSKSAAGNDGETQSRNLESDAESNEEKGTNGVPEKSNEEVSEQAENIGKESESEVESEVEVDKANKNRGSGKSSEKGKTKKPTISKKINPPPKKTPPSHSKKRKNDTSEKIPSGKKKGESIKKSSTSKKSASKESSGKKTPKVNDKLKEEASKPSDDELKNTVCEILKEVDFNTATFTDILKLLGKRFDMDMMPRKSSIKVMIQDELTIIANAADEGDADKKL